MLDLKSIWSLKKSKKEKKEKKFDLNKVKKAPVPLLSKRSL